MGQSMISVRLRENPWTVSPRMDSDVTGVAVFASAGFQLYHCAHVDS